MARPRKQPDRIPTREQILAAAEQVFANLGYAAARLEDVAQAVGLRRSSIVHYFPSKQALYDAVEAGIFGEMQRLTAERLARAATPWERVLAVLDTWLDFMVLRPHAARVINRLAADRAGREHNPVEFSEPAVEALEAAVEAGVRAGTFRAVRGAHVLNIVGGGILQFVCNASQLGESRTYRFDDPAEIAAFRDMTHRAARALLMRDEPAAG